MSVLEVGSALAAVAAMDYLRASAIANHLLWPLQRVLELLASAVDLPVVGGVAAAVFVAIGVLGATVAFLLTLTIVLIWSIAAAPGAGSALPAHLEAALLHGRQIFGLFRWI